jgi:hypothetical protein
MTRVEFVEALESELQLHAEPFSRANVLAFVEGAWPLIEDDPDPGRWAREFSAVARD